MELLSSYDFPGDDVPIVTGSALKALEGDQSDIGEPSILKLVDAMDAHIPQPQREIDKPFLMPIEDVFSISGRVAPWSPGASSAARSRSARKSPSSASGPRSRPSAPGWKCSANCWTRAKPATTWGPAARHQAGRRRTRPSAGQARHHHPAHQLRSRSLRPGQGRRRAAHPFFKGYRPQFYFRTTDVTGSVDLPEGVEMVMPGDNVRIVVSLIAPIAMDEGLRFAIREGGRTVGAGVVAKVIE